MDLDFPGGPAGDERLAPVTMITDALLGPLDSG